MLVCNSRVVAQYACVSVPNKVFLLLWSYYTLNSATIALLDTKGE